MLALLIPGVGMGGGTASAPIFSGTIPDITWAQNTGSHAYTLGTYFSGATSYSIAPAIEAGWTFDTVTADFSVDTDAVGIFGPYVVTGTNAVGSAPSNGFTVTITALVTVTDEQNSGGWNFHVFYDQELKRRRQRKRELEEIEEEREQIEDTTAREIAELLSRQEAEDEKRRDLERLSALAKAHADLDAARAFSDRVAVAYQRALEKGTFSALEALDRELKRAAEEEEFMQMALALLLGEQ